MSNKIPIYLSELIKKYPSILSGRKNIKSNHQRIIQSKKLIKKFLIKNPKNTF